MSKRIPTEKQLAALKPWKKGQAGGGHLSPNVGRPIKPDWQRLVSDLALRLPNGKLPQTREELPLTQGGRIIDKLLTKAEEGDVNAIKEAMKGIGAYAPEKRETKVLLGDVDLSKVPIEKVERLYACIADIIGSDFSFVHEGSEETYSQ